MNLEDEQISQVEKGVLSMNNFWTKLPDDHYDPIPGFPFIHSGTHRIELSQSGDIDNIIGGFGYSTSKHSQLFLGQTWRFFFKTIDDLVADFGLENDIYQCFDQARHPGSIQELRLAEEIAIGDTRIPLEERLQALATRNRLNSWRHEVSRIALPVFRVMKVSGYQEYDLTI